MMYLQRLSERPTFEGLSKVEVRYIQSHFDPYADEVIVNRQAIPWDVIDEVEIAVAARTPGPSGWLVKNLIMGGERYHVGLYFGRDEAVLTNLTLNTARYIVQMVAFYSPRRVSYRGPDGLTPVDDF
jgi:hypothetical protein